VGKVYRHDLKPSISSLVFQATPGVVMTPVTTENNYHIFLVEEFIPAQLTDELYQMLLDQMFQDWLARELDYLLFNKVEDQDNNNENSFIKSH
jgi:parvulin-like peptidyl-prolyl isomerase